MKKQCTGRCVYPSDIGLPEYDFGDPAYPDPECELHGWHDAPMMTVEEEEEAPPDVSDAGV